MFSLTVREQTLIAAVLLAVASGSVIHHYRTRPATDLTGMSPISPTLPDADVAP